MEKTYPLYKYLETKNHFSRDDPAFVVIQSFFLVVNKSCNLKIVSICYAIAFRNKFL